MLRLGTKVFLKKEEGSGSEGARGHAGLRPVQAEEMEMDVDENVRNGGAQVSSGLFWARELRWRNELR